MINRLTFILFAVLVMTVSGNGQTTINSWEDLHNVRNNLSGNYILNVDLNERSPGYDTYASATANGGLGWEPLGNSSSPFTGTFDGNNKIINGLFINRPTEVGVGFFGRTIGATIVNLTLANVDITGSHEVGGLIGTNREGTVTEVNNVHVTGVVSSARTGNNAADCGGLLGYIYDINVINSSTSVSVTAIGRNVGGIVGDGVTNSSLSNCFATGPVTSTGAQGHVGGFAGLYRGNGISNSFSLGSVTRGGTTGSTSVGAGGFIGRLSGSASEITNCYSIGKVTSADAVSTNIGGFVGTGAAVTSTLTNCYWDTDVSNLTDAYGDGTKTGVTGSTTAQMKTQTTFSGWDFSGVWSMSSSLTYHGYPALDYTSPVGIAPTTTNEIATLANLLWIAEDNARWNGNYIQTANINAAFVLGWDGNASSSNEYEPRGWSPIGNSTTKFTGSYNGDGHTISNLFINRPNEQRIALFGETNGATIERLGLVDPDITVTGTGFMVGSNTGSLVGFAGGTSISECFATGGSVTSVGAGVGGLIGQLWNSSLNNSYSIVAVDGASDGFSAGLVGVNTSSTITNCYAAGSVDVNIGYSRGLSQNNGGTITNSFYDSDATGQSTGGGTAKTTLEMQQQATFTNWDFQCEAENGTANFWGIDEGNDYPRLSWEGFTQDCTLEWTGAVDSDWENVENWNKPYLPSDLTPVSIPNVTNQPVISSSANVLSIDMLSGADVTVAPSISLFVEGNINSEGQIILQANTSGDYAQLKFDGNYSGTGEVTQQQYLNGGWVMMGASMNATTADFFGNVGSTGPGHTGLTQNLFSWNGQDYVNVTNNSTTITPGMGYFGFVGNFGIRPAAGVHSFSGTPNTSVTVPTLYSTSSVADNNVTMSNNVTDREGWNLLANPFTCNLDISGVPRSADFNNAFYLYDGTNYTAIAPGGIDDGVVPPLSAFWMQASGTSPTLGSAGAMTMSDNGTISNVGSGFARPAFDRLVLRTHPVGDTIHTDYTVVSFIDGTTDGFDGAWDGHKMLKHMDYPNIFSTHTDGSAMAINAIPYGPNHSEKRTVPISFKAAQHGQNFTIRYDDSYMINHYAVYLEDKLLQTFTDLSAQDYSFINDTSMVGRFVLHFRAGSLSIDAPESTKNASGISAWVFDNHAYLNPQFTGNAMLTLYDISGKKLQAERIEVAAGVRTEWALRSGLAAGVYLFRVETAVGTETIKFTR